ncbi:MAG: type II secretion system protein [Phycisphaeraceae bacterium]|nr:type II secretion system protein [Phycisphaeraceae bacterium]
MRPCRRKNRTRPAFSMVELIIVMVIVGLVSAMAIPRLSSAADRSRVAATTANLRLIARAIEYYAAEHADRGPLDEPDGSTTSDGDLVASRLTARTTASGQVSSTGPFGPYLRTMPPNPYNRLATIRIGGAAAGANTHGWRLDPATRLLAGDHPGVVAPSGGGDGALAVDGGAAVADGELEIAP